MEQVAKKIERWFQTFTGKLVDAEHPTPDMVDIQDIAHALSMTCRYGGHCREFYSVAEHSVRVEELGLKLLKSRSRKTLEVVYVLLQSQTTSRTEEPAELQLALLLHDAAEAYMGDIISPVKTLLAPRSTELEDKWLAAIEEKFHLGHQLTLPAPVVREVDSLALSVEVLSLFYPVSPEWWTKFPVPTHDQFFPVECWPPHVARQKFLDRFYELQEILGCNRTMFSTKP